jgi:hypothetical protein
MTTSAQSFINQILEAWNNVQKAEGDALKHAIDCGKLTLAKDNIEAENNGKAASDKTKWLDWLETNTHIPQTTASLYMRLAKHRNLIKKAKTIREAIKMLPTAPVKPEVQVSRDKRKADNDAARQAVNDLRKIGWKPEQTLEEVQDARLKQMDEKDLAEKIKPKTLDALAERRLKAQDDGQRKGFIVKLVRELSLQDAVDVMSHAFPEKWDVWRKALDERAASPPKSDPPPRTSQPSQAALSVAAG